jgi:hypothetical protein
MEAEECERLLDAQWGTLKQRVDTRALERKCQEFLATVVHALGDLQRLETVRFLCSHTPQSGGLVDEVMSTCEKNYNYVVLWGRSLFEIYERLGDATGEKALLASQVNHFLRRLSQTQITVPDYALLRHAGEGEAAGGGASRLVFAEGGAAAPRKIVLYDRDPHAKNRYVVALSLAYLVAMVPALVPTERVQRYDQFFDLPALADLAAFLASKCGGGGGNTAMPRPALSASKPREATQPAPEAREAREARPLKKPRLHATNVMFDRAECELHARDIARIATLRRAQGEEEYVFSAHYTPSALRIIERTVLELNEGAPEAHFDFSAAAQFTRPETRCRVSWAATPVMRAL